MNVHYLATSNDGGVFDRWIEQSFRPIPLSQIRGDHDEGEELVNAALFPFAPVIDDGDAYEIAQAAVLITGDSSYLRAGTTEHTRVSAIYGMMQRQQVTKWELPLVLSRACYGESYGGRNLAHLFLDPRNRQTWKRAEYVRDEDRAKMTFYRVGNTTYARPFDAPIVPAPAIITRHGHEDYGDTTCHFILDRKTGEIYFNFEYCFNENPQPIMIFDPQYGVNKEPRLFVIRKDDVNVGNIESSKLPMLMWALPYITPTTRKVGGRGQA